MGGVEVRVRMCKCVCARSWREGAGLHACVWTCMNACMYVCARVGVSVGVSECATVIKAGGKPVCKVICMLVAERQS